MGNLILALILVGAAAIMMFMIARSTKFQSEGKIGVIETFGRFSRVVLPGRYFLWPWDRVRAEVPLQLFIWDAPEQKLLTKSGAPVTLTMVVYFQLAHVSPPVADAARVLGSTPQPRGSNLLPGTSPAPPAARFADTRPATARRAGMSRGGAMAMTMPAGPLAPELNLMSRIMGRRQFRDVEHAAYRAVYTVEDWQRVTKDEALDVLHQTFAKLDLGRDLFGKDDWQRQVADQLRQILNEKTQRWGVDIHEINFKNVQFAELTMQNLTAETRARRDALIKRIEAESQKEIAEMLGLDTNTLLQWRYIDAMKELAKNTQARFMLSTNMAGGGGGPALVPDEQGPGVPTSAMPITSLPPFPPPNPMLAPPPAFGAHDPAMVADRDQQ